MRDRVAISARLLAEINNADYEAIRQKDINSLNERIESITPEYRAFAISRANTSASDRKIEDIKKHYSYHAGHCAECENPLITAVYALDKNVSRDCGKFGIRWDIVKLPACVTHSQWLKNKTYSMKLCRVCNVLFETYGTSDYCSTACRNYANYQMNKKIVQPKKCVACDAEFIPKRTDAVYCGGKCRTANHRAVKIVTGN